MSSNGIWITYNGEVYNYKEIKNELLSLGHCFRSDSDTEVVLEAYREWGIECLKKFRGMFSMAVWDNGILFLARDRAGVKPLYYYFDGKILVFASELKAIFNPPGFKKEIDFDSLALYLQFGYIKSPRTIFKNTFKVKPGHFLKIKKGEIKEEKYWDISDFYSEKNDGKELEERLKESFRYRLVSDVPVGIFLSGGVDSSTVSALLSSETRLKTFTIGFHNKNYNEAPYAKRVADYLKTDHHEFYCAQKEALETVFLLPEIYDEPFGDSSAIPTYLVSKMARDYVKVALSADGGDELFSGYTYYKKISRIFKLRKPLFLARQFIPSKSIRMEKLKKMLENNDIESFYRIILSYWMEDDLKDILKVPFNREHPSSFISMQDSDFKTYLPDDILAKVDRASMAVGLEAREPFLDQNIIEYAAGMHAKDKNQLKKILYKYVPKKLVDRPKQGFGIPVHEWLKEDLKPILMDYLSPSKLKRGGIFNEASVKRNLDEYLGGKTEAGRKIWVLLSFQMWHERWM